MAGLDSLSKDALTLSPDERVALAQRLLVSVEPNPSPEVDVAWENEILRRIAEFDSGRVQPISADSVFARLREIAPNEMVIQSRPLFIATEWSSRYCSKL